MQFNSLSESAQEKQFFPQKQVLRLLIIVFLFISAFSIRFCYINQPPLEFHPTRQYRSAFVTRAYYFETATSIPEWRKQVAVVNKQREGIMEPPIREFAASFAYHTMGGEHLWILRLMSSIFWLIGGVFLYLIAKDIASTDAAIFSTAFYLFLPFGISASRSLQPEPLMIMALLISLFTILKYFEQPSRPKLILAASISAIALLIKPPCLFLILGAFISLAIFKQGIRRAVINQNFWLFIAVSFLPTSLYYLYGIFFATGLLREVHNQAQVSFFPHFLLQSFFWKKWLNTIGEVVGYTALIGALFGLLMIRKGLPRALLIGLWSGYFIFGLIFNYHIHTHDYYSLQFVPVVALSIGPIVALVVNHLANQVRTQWRRRLAVIILVLGMLLSISEARGRIFSSEHESVVRVAQEIGEAVGHSTNTIFLSSAYGKPLRYHGEIGGMYWPPSEEIQAERLLGEAEIGAEERFNSDYAKYSSEYFIVSDLGEFEQQPDLKDFLSSKFPILVQNGNYLVFDLRKRSDKEKADLEQ
jgi:4-amino-4-deoxy-L-arabinose transferase-like glycosyltransferase